MELPEWRGKLAAASPVAVDLSSEKRGRQFQSVKCGLQVISCDTVTGPRTAKIFDSTIFCVSLGGCCLMRQTSELINSVDVHILNKPHSTCWRF